MSIKDIKLKKGMTKDEVNNLIGEWLILEDDVYLGNSYKHSWTCKCGELIKGRRWTTIAGNETSSKCKKCNKKVVEEIHKNNIEKYNDFEYLKTLYTNDILPNGKVINRETYVQVKHKYCGEIYFVRSRNFSNKIYTCSKCCGSYENSFAYHIEVELGEPIEKYWDFEKNTANPYHISKGSHKKVWIKCTEKDYHGSYEMSCDKFINGNRCPYCSSKKVHLFDSFAKYCLDNTDKDFLTKYWSDKNTVDPWTISPNSGKKVWIKCQEKDYHDDYEVSCDKFISGRRCPYCINKKVRSLDSFGYHNFDKVQSWHLDNDISPFKVAPNSGKKYKFICPECNNVWSARLADINYGQWCPQCNSSKGEKEITKWLRLNNIEFLYDEPYFNDLLSDKNKPLRPDFILPNHKIWIEYDGEFHYKKYYEDQNYETLKIHDKSKDEYAKRHGWKLIRIPYYDFDNIEEILKNELNI